MLSNTFHLAVPAGDLDAAIDFYCNILGCKKGCSKKEILDRIVEILKDISVVDKPADWQGQRISIILSPK